MSGRRPPEIDGLNLANPPDGCVAGEEGNGRGRGQAPHPDPTDEPCRWRFDPWRGGRALVSAGAVPRVPTNGWTQL